MIHPQNFFVAGISFKKTDIRLRSKFAFAPDQCSSIYAATKADCFQHFFILSTCNRTEVYGFAPCRYVLYSLFQQHANASPEEVNQYVYVKEGNDAVRHFLSVASGMDSQIPGDYEIISQIKSAFQLAKEHQRTNGYLERLFNFAMQASKEVKANTSFSQGTVSAIYATVQKLSRQKAIHKVVVLGAGSTGQQTVGYLKKLIPSAKIILMNRDAEKLKTVASIFNIQGSPLENLHHELKDADAMIVATNASKPLVTREHLIGSRIRFIFDLSVPQNVAEDVCTMDQLKYYNVDSISTLTDATIQVRLAEIPKVKDIVINYERKFSEWSARHHYFSLASQASVAGNLLSRKALTGLFDQWHKSQQYDQTFIPYSARASDSILLALKSAYPTVRLSTSLQETSVHASCCTHSHHETADLLCGKSMRLPTD
ncbi:MAG TPA: glutamyl-tRNA reductase [Chryseosolibacter sp.]